MRPHATLWLTTHLAILGLVLTLRCQSFAQDPKLPHEPSTLDVQTMTIRIQHYRGRDSFEFTVDQPVLLAGADQTEWLNPGQWRITLSEATPATRLYHVFVKSFRVHEEEHMPAFLKDLRAQGYTPTVHTVGRQFRMRDGQTVDNRSFWIAAAISSDSAEAEKLKNLFNEKGTWAWVRTEILKPGNGYFVVTDDTGATVARIPAPATLHSVRALHFLNVDQGYLEKRIGHEQSVGPFTITVGIDSTIEVFATHTISDYLKEVLPAEMPARWPANALKAQAVAARSEIFASLAGKHRLEGFDFCTREHCRAWKGFDVRSPETDEAVDDTTGEILLVAAIDGRGPRVATTVYSANCGGATENNDNVWAGPPNSTLRGISDSPAVDDAYCAADEKYFRWSRKFSATELSIIVNKYHAIGALQAIKPGDRGLSGRYKSVRLVGDKGTATVHRELAIRRALGGLPSAAFTVSQSVDGTGGAQFAFDGAGRGHGVGMCQQGAKGMALHDIGYYDILKHYFSGVTIGNLR